MNFIVNKFLFNLVYTPILLFLATNSLVAQIDSTTVKDSLQNTQTLNVQFNGSRYHSLVDNPFYFNHIHFKYDSALLPFKFDFSVTSDIEDYPYPPLALISQTYNKRMELNYALNLQRKWAEEKSLGVLGQIISYANAAAAAALLYMHLKKYNQDSGF